MNSQDNQDSQGPGPIPQREANPWDEIIPFDKTSNLPEFPVNALPDPLDRMVTETSESIQIAPDVPAMLSLTIAVAAGASRCDVVIGETHREPMAIWTTSLLRSGERKSAAFEAMTEPVVSWEAEVLAAYAEENRATIELINQTEERVKHLRKQQAKQSDASKRAQMQSEAERLVRSMPELPPSPGIILQDVTPEILPMRMAAQGGRATIYNDEGGIFGLLAGRYAKNGWPNLDAFLKGHAGTPIKVDRVTRGADTVRRPALSMGLTVQPAILSVLSREPHLRGIGVTARFAFSIPRSRVGGRLYAARAINPAVREAYHRAVYQAYSSSSRRPETPDCLRITGDALACWTGFHNSIEVQLKEGGPLESIADWGSKAAGLAARIAGGFQLMIHPQDGWLVPVAQETIERAITITEYLVKHAEATFGLIGADPDAVLAIRFLAWIVRTSRATFTVSELKQAFRQLRPDAIAAPLKILEERSYIRPVGGAAHAGPGRKPSPKYEVHPDCVSHCEERPKNTDNPGNRQNRPDSQESQHSQEPSASETAAAQKEWRL